MNTLSSQIDSVRNTVFTYKRTDMTLWDHPLIDIVSDTALIRLFNDAQDAVSVYFPAEPNIKYTTLQVGSPHLPMPDDFLCLKDILIYDQTDTSGGGTHTGETDLSVLVNTEANFSLDNFNLGVKITNTTTGATATVSDILSTTSLATSDLQGGSSNLWTTGDTYEIENYFVERTDGIYTGRQLTQVGGHQQLSGLANQQGLRIVNIENDEISVSEANNGKPSKYLLLFADGDNFPTGTTLAAFDTTPSARNLIDIEYYPIEPYVSGSNNDFRLANIYSDLYYTYTASKVAQRIGDIVRQRNFEQDFRRYLDECKKIVHKRDVGTVVTPIFNGGFLRPINC